MWKLRSTKKDHWDHFVFVGEDCIVGRKDATLLISNDPSVSRKHAVLTVKHPEENLGYPARKSSLFLRDEGSKYGSFKNGVRITSQEQLFDGDIIKFGQFESEFRIHYEPLIVTSSCLDFASKNKLKKAIQKLGGHLVSEWQPACTHLVMSLVKVTIKALCCLVSLKSIVLPNYFDELEKKLKSSASEVPPSEFIPPIGESLIDKDEVSFDVNPQRKNLFKDKTFFFMDDKQFKKLHLGIIMGGGKASILSEGKVDQDLLLHENSCFIEPGKAQLVKEESKNLYSKILSNLQKKNLRIIPESDVGLAVVYASTEKFCNPSFNLGSAAFGSQIPSQTLTEREVYVPDTQDSVQRPKPSIKKFLSDTSSSEPKSKKQKLEAPDSLNLTSFRGDPEDVFEIPLSAQVKEELDNLFDITAKDADDDVQEEELPSTLHVDPPCEPEVQVKRLELLPEPEVRVKRFESSPEPEVRVKRFKSSPEPEVRVKHFKSSPEPEVRLKRFESKKTDKTVPKKSISPKKPKIEKKPTLVNRNGFTSVTMNDEDEADIPNFTMNGINEADLPRNQAVIKYVSLIVRKPALSSQQSRNPTVKNFKKFKKVLPLKAQVLPVIIGGNDLLPYDRNATKLAEEIWNDEIEAVNNRAVKGAFDWDSQN